MAGAQRRERKLLPALGIATVLLAGLLVLVHAQTPRPPPGPQTVLGPNAQSESLDRLAEGTDDRPLRVAVIGGGAGGSSAAFFVSHLARAAGDKEVSIRIFERRDYLGGRSTIIHPFDEPPKADSGYEPVEAGASIFVGANRNLVKAANEFNLTTTPYKDSTGDGGRFGVWDGDKMVWEQSPSSQGGRWDQARMLWRYGLSLRNIDGIVKAMVDSYLNFYKREYIKTSPHETVDAMAAAISQEFRRLPTLTGSEYLINEKGVNNLFVNELVEAATRTNYGTDVNAIHSLVTLVSLAANDAVKIKGGNRQLFEAFADRSGARVTLNAEVTTIGEVEAKDGRRELMLTYQDARSPSATATEPFDAVIVAAPYGQASLNVVTSSPFEVPHQPYVRLHVTFIATSASQPDKKAFKRKDGDWDVPKTVFSTMMPNVEGHGKRPRFNSLSYLRNVGPRAGVEGDVHIVKMFSEAELSDGYVASLFGGPGNVHWTERIAWDAYPILSPVSPGKEHYAPFKLSDRVYYANGIERLISCMEVATLGAWNVASLLARDAWGYKPPSSWAEWDLGRA